MLDFKRQISHNNGTPKISVHFSLVLIISVIRFQEFESLNNAQNPCLNVLPYSTV